MDASVTVTVDPGIPESEHDRLRSDIKQALIEHLRLCEGLVDTAALDAVVTEFSRDQGQAIFSITLSGTLNGQPVERKAHARRSPRKAVGFGGAVGGAIIGVITLAFVGTKVGALHLRQCFKECMAELCLAIDDVIGRHESMAAAAWRSIAAVRWVAAVAVLIPLVVRSVMFRGSFALFVAGMLLAGSVFGIIHAMGLFFMPTSFFLNEPRGRKALSRSGVRSVIGLRIVCFFFALIMLLLLMLGIRFSLEAFFPEPQKGD